MGIEYGDPWQVHQYTATLNFNRATGMKRIHYHLGHALGLSLR